jgi:hypothetical protein
MLGPVEGGRSLLDGGACDGVGPPKFPPGGEPPGGPTPLGGKRGTPGPGGGPPPGGNGGGPERGNQKTYDSRL